MVPLVALKVAEEDPAATVADAGTGAERGGVARECHAGAAGGRDLSQCNGARAGGILPKAGGTASERGDLYRCDQGARLQ